MFEEIEGVRSASISYRAKTSSRAPRFSREGSVEALVGVVVVFDKYHIIQLMNQRLDELRREMVREAEGAMKMVIKGTRYLLLTRAANLKEDQLPKLERALKLNEPLSQAWSLKEELALLWDQSSYAEMTSVQSGFLNW